MNWSNDAVIQTFVELILPFATFLGILFAGFLLRALLFMR